MPKVFRQHGLVDFAKTVKDDLWAIFRPFYVIRLILSGQVSTSSILLSLSINSQFFIKRVKIYKHYYYLCIKMFGSKLSDYDPVGIQIMVDGALVVNLTLWAWQLLKNKSYKYRELDPWQLLGITWCQIISFLLYFWFIVDFESSTPLLFFPTFLHSSILNCPFDDETA